VTTHPYRAVSLHADLADDNVPEFFQHKFMPADDPPQITLYEYRGPRLPHPAGAAKEGSPGER
jgi:hypothetical protein